MRVANENIQSEKLVRIGKVHRKSFGNMYMHAIAKVTRTITLKIDKPFAVANGRAECTTAKRK